VRHHELVVEAGSQLCDAAISELVIPFSREDVLLGCAFHDVGKILYPDEMLHPGHRHEEAGQALLLERGVEPNLARFCVTHASWNHSSARIEDLFVALADKLWKGARQQDLESRTLAVLCECTGREAWQVFERLDGICERIAYDGLSRLSRSVSI